MGGDRIGPRTGAVVLAAGLGKRMQSARPKQFLDLGGAPLFAHSLAFFLRLECIQCVCLTSGRDALRGAPGELARAMAAEAGKPIVFAEGGLRRQDSALAGLRALPPDIEIALTHDAARPFPPLAPTLEAIRRAGEMGGAILAIPATDTVKLAGKDLAIERTLDRSALWLAQTPQVFGRAAILEALEAAERSGVELTDEAMAFERLGWPVRLIPSTAANMKATTPEDLPKAERYLAELDRRNAPLRSFLAFDAALDSRREL